MNGKRHIRIAGNPRSRSSSGIDQPEHAPVTDYEDDPGEEKGGDGESDLPKDQGRKYIIPARDSKGHSGRLYCYCMPQHQRMIIDLLSKHTFPFRSQGDVLRWCVDYGVRELYRRKGSGPSVMQQVDIILEIMRDEMYQQDFVDTFQTMHTVINRHLSAQAIGEARRAVALVKQSILAMPEGFWRERYLKELGREFGHLLEGEGTQFTGE